MGDFPLYFPSNGPPVTQHYLSGAVNLFLVPPGDHLEHSFSPLTFAEPMLFKRQALAMLLQALAIQSFLSDPLCFQ